MLRKYKIKRKIELLEQQVQSTANKLKKSTTQEENVVVSEDIYADGSCADVNCTKPVGTCINWVQCDECNKWYHMECVNILPENVTAESEYICPQCTNKKIIQKQVHLPVKEESTKIEANKLVEICEAETCLKPTSENIAWLQCDGGCDKLFHMGCVGVLENDFRENEEYICRNCSSAESFTTLVPTSPVTAESSQPSTSKDTH